MREIEPISPPDASVAVPGSKSITNRGLLIGALADGETVLDGALHCEDTVRLVESLRKLGFFVREEPGAGRIRLEGEGGRIPAHRARLDVGASGTALRFLTALAALGPGRYEIDGDAGLRARPVEPLCGAIRAIGGEARSSGHGGAPVVVARADVVGGSLTLPGEISSQFASALLMVAPYLAFGLDLRLNEPVVSAPYIGVTVSVMRAFGAAVDAEEARRFVVAPGGYRGRTYCVEGDATSASYFFAAAAVTGGRVRVTNLGGRCGQGDVAMLDLLASMGAAIERGDGWAEVRGGPLRGVDANLKDAPDLAPTLAAVAMTAEGPTRVRGVPHLRLKESDRLRAIAGAVAALGGEAECFDDGLLVSGGGAVRPGVVDPMGDHRIAMAFAVLGLVHHGVRILTPEVVGKSFPDFFARLAALGG